MSVVKIESGVVVQTWRDVKTVDEAVAKYGLDPDTLVEADHASGMLFAGGVFTAPPATAAVPPSTVSKLQLVRALRLTGDWGAVKASIKQSSTDVKEDWELAYQINRDDAIMSEFADALSLTEADVDALFVSAETL